MTAAPMMAAMRSISPRSQRLAQVKFVALPLDPPCPRREAPISRPEARFMRWLRRFAIRVIGSPMAARL